MCLHWHSQVKTNTILQKCVKPGQFEVAKTTERSGNPRAGSILVHTEFLAKIPLYAIQTI